MSKSTRWKSVFALIAASAVLQATYGCWGSTTAAQQVPTPIPTATPVPIKQVYLFVDYTYSNSIPADQLKPALTEIIKTVYGAELDLKIFPITNRTDFVFPISKQSVEGIRFTDGKLEILSPGGDTAVENRCKMAAEFIYSDILDYNSRSPKGSNFQIVYSELKQLRRRNDILIALISDCMFQDEKGNIVKVTRNGKAESGLPHNLLLFSARSQNRLEEFQDAKADFVSAVEDIGYKVNDCEFADVNQKISESMSE